MTQDEPYNTHEIAEQHWCEAVGSTLYCPQIDCPYCGETHEDQ